MAVRIRRCRRDPMSYGRVMSHRNVALLPHESDTACTCTARIRERRPWIQLGLALSLSVLFLASSPLLGQESERKVLKKVTPQYPAILRQRGIGGTVRLQVTVEPSGEVSSVAVLGGNAILADQAQAAVKQWRFAPSPKSTISEVRINFDPHGE